MKRLTLLVMCLALGASACDQNSPTTPTPTIPTFTFPLLSSNEVPPVTNAESTASGNVTIKLNITRDAANAITAATVDFAATLAGLPAGANVTAAHIHEAAAGVNGSVRINTGLASGEVTLTAGAGTFTKNAINVTDVAIIQRILDNPSAFYFNVHTTLNPGGVVRAQLVRTQ